MPRIILRNWMTVNFVHWHQKDSLHWRVLWTVTNCQYLIFHKNVKWYVLTSTFLSILTLDKNNYLLLVYISTFCRNRNTLNFSLSNFFFLLRMENLNVKQLQLEIVPSCSTTAHSGFITDWHSLPWSACSPFCVPHNGSLEPWLCPILDSFTLSHTIVILNRFLFDAWKGEKA